MSGRELKKGQVLFTTEAPMGNVAQVPDDNGYILSQRTVAFETKEDMMTNDFLAVLLKSPLVFNNLSALSSGGTAKGVSQKSLKGLSITVPLDIDEQQKIGSFFKQLDDTIALHQRKLSHLRELKRGLLQRMFPKSGEDRPEVRFPGFADAWEQRKAREIFEPVSKKGYPKFPVLSASQTEGMVFRDEIGIDIKYDQASLKSYKLVSSGQFVIHLRSFQGGLAYSRLTGITSPAYTVIKIKHEESQAADFWAEILRSPTFIQRLGTVTYGIRDGRSISYSDFSTLKFQFPVKAEQQKIGEFFKSLEDLITLHQRKLSHLQQQKKALLQQMFV
jgi:type I restriction enzyme S subunit